MGIFGFGGEKYSKEAYRDAEEKVKEAEENVRKNPVGRGYLIEGEDRRDEFM